MPAPHAGAPNHGADVLAFETNPDPLQDLTLFAYAKGYKLDFYRQVDDNTLYTIKYSNFGTGRSVPPATRVSGTQIAGRVHDALDGLPVVRAVDARDVAGFQVMVSRP
ncbi:hypothetical protein DFH11DRAFT_1549630 [Phellopilus nigrolimitatus]|nr:hypothetical protein DFH11DRAFT_1549630 [Phellopilus nigrolimitatus]